MSKMKYKIEVYASNTKQILVSSDVERMGPDTIPIGYSDWNTDKWNENSRSAKLIRAIGDKKKFGFVTSFDTASKYWTRKYKNGDQLEMVTIKVIGNGFSKRVHLHEVKVIPLSELPVYVGGEAICVGFRLQFNDSDIGENWSLNN